MEVQFVNLGLQYKELKEEILEKIDYISSRGSYVLSEEVENFEKNFAKYCGVKYSVGVGNGSDAIFFSLLSQNIGKDDEIITAPNSFVATAWTIANCGAKIVFSDVGEDYNINPHKIEKLINKKTKAIIPVHLTGKIADMDAISKIAQKHNLIIIEDAAQAVGAKYKDKKAGSFGITGCFSLHPLKNLHVNGDGGVVTTNDKETYHYLKKIRNHGLLNRDECEFWGYNSRLDSIKAGIANIKLKYLDKWNNRFRQIALYYRNELEDFLEVPKENSFEKPIYHRFIIQFQKRDDLKKFLFEKGIETKINYPIPLHLHPAASDLEYRIGDFPVAEKQAKRILSLPIYAELSDNEVEYVVQCIKHFFK